MSQEFNRAKFKELLLYIAESSADDPRFGATKLNKILFYSDFLHYGLHGEAITGATYQRLDRGPAPRELLPVQRELTEKEGDAEIIERTRFGYPQKRLTPKRDPDLSLFNGDEIAVVEAVIDHFHDHNAREVSDISHAELAWKIAGDREEIPYDAVFLASQDLSPADIDRAQELAQEHGWAAA